MNTNLHAQFKYIATEAGAGSLADEVARRAVSVVEDHLMSISRSLLDLNDQHHKVSRQDAVAVLSQVGLPQVPPPPAPAAPAAATSGQAQPQMGQVQELDLGPVKRALNEMAAGVRALIDAVNRF